MPDWWVSVSFHSLQALFTQGGWVLWLIALLALAIFVLGLERLAYCYWWFPAELRMHRDRWQARLDQNSWRAQRIRDAWLASADRRLQQTLWFFRFAILVSPMLGLLGTVSGMISVFDVLGYVGTGNPRLMASGIFQATIPTMAGMMVAIVGLLLRALLQRRIQQRQQQMRTALASLSFG